MNRTFLCLVVACIGASPVFAQNTFERTYGGSGADFWFSVQETLDGGFILAGSMESELTGGAEMVLIRTDMNGDELWINTYGSLAPDFAYSVQQTSDGGYVLCGMFGGFGSDTLTVVRTTAEGIVVWERQYPGGLGRDIGYCIRQTADAGFVISGFAGTSDDTDVYVVRLEAGGNMLWSTTVDLGGNDYGNAIMPLTGGGYIVLADDGEVGTDGDLHLLRLDDGGDTLWTRTLGTPEHDHARGLWVTDEGGYVIAGGSGYPDREILLLRTDAQGNELWQRSIGDADRDEIARDIQQLEDGGFIVCGRRDDVPAGSPRAHLFRTDALGNLQWERLLGEGVVTTANALDRTSDNGYVLIGSTSDTTGGTLRTDIHLVKTDDAGYVSVDELADATGSITLAPVPAQHLLHITLHGLVPASVQVYDATGHLVRTWPALGRTDLQLPVHDLPPGTYILTVRDAHGARTDRRFVVAR